MQENELGGLLALAAIMVAWGLVSARFARWNISMPMAFVASGVVIGHGGLAVVELSPSNESFRMLAELTLALLLFADASRVNIHALRLDAAIPTRLLLLSLPISILFGSAAAWFLLPGITLAVAAVIGAAAAPTDAALGAAILSDPSVPARIRRILTVESGLNDGIATPFVSMFIALAATTESQVGLGGANALLKLFIGLALGAGIGAVGGVALRWSRRAGWAAEEFLPIATAALALLAYSVAVVADGNGFIAAFVGGMAFGATALRPSRTAGPVDREEPEHALSFANGGGEVLSAIVWFLFGAALPNIVPTIDWREGLFAVVALTVARMVPVALSLVGAGTNRRTVGFIGWSGPRGLATVVFGLLAVADLPEQEGALVIGALTATVLLSIVAHGVSAAPLARWYGQAERAGNGTHVDLPLGVAPLAPRGRLAMGRRTEQP